MHCRMSFLLPGVAAARLKIVNSQKRACTSVKKDVTYVCVGGPGIRGRGCHPSLEAESSSVGWGLAFVYMGLLGLGQRQIVKEGEGGRLVSLLSSVVARQLP